MRNHSQLAILLLFIPFLLAMGSSPTSGPSEIPTPEKKFKATFIDLMEITTECKDISIDGKTFLEGKLGNGIHAIPFENIKEITLLMEGERLKGVVKLKDGHHLNMELDKKHTLYGRTRYGNFLIKIQDLKKIVFLN